MDMILAFIAVDIFLILVALAFTWRSKLISIKQKVLQMLFAVLLPFIGPIYVVLVHLSDILKPEVSEFSEHSYRGHEKFPPYM